jgi:hypothetical protein
VLHLPAFWKSLSQDAELKRELAQPPEYAARWLIPVGLVVFGIFVIVSGDPLGLLLLAVGGAAGWWMHRSTGVAREARERWERLMYCRTCPAQFEPGKA